MKKTLVLAVMATAMLTSCKEVLYTANYQNLQQTQVVLSNNNFKVLGSFSGSITGLKYKLNVKNAEGLVSQAKRKMLENAKAAGVELTGSRALVNLSVDAIHSTTRVTVTVSGDIIEFTK
jgi:hypothetical protein